MQGTVAVVALVATSGYVIESTKQWNPMPAPGTFVEIEDEHGAPIKIHLQQKGSGQFTVIFDGGVGETSFDWDKVMDQVRGEHSCIHDRNEVVVVIPRIAESGHVSTCLCVVLSVCLL